MPFTMFDLCKLNGLLARRHPFGLFSWIQMYCNWTDKTANFVCQSQSKWIQLNRQKERLLAGRPFNLRKSNIVPWSNIFLILQPLWWFFLFESKLKITRSSTTTKTQLKNLKNLDFSIRFWNTQQCMAWFVYSYH